MEALSTSTSLHEKQIKKNVQDYLDNLPDFSVKDIFNRKFSLNPQLDMKLRKAYFRFTQISFFSPCHSLKNPKTSYSNLIEDDKNKEKDCGS